MRSVCILPKFKSGNGAVMNLVRTVGKTQRANAGIGLGKASVVGDAAAAPRLDCVVDDLQRHVRRRHLDHGDLELRGLVADLVHHVGRLAHAVRNVHDAVRTGLDLSAIMDSYDEERGFPPYHPGMMVALLLYAYS